MATISAKPKSKSTASEPGWLKKLFTRPPKARVKTTKHRKVVGTVGEKSERRFNFGGIATQLALTVLIATFAILMRPPTLDLTRWFRIDGATAGASAADAGASLVSDPNCSLREWTGNAVVDPHWPDIRRWCSSIMQAGNDYQVDPYLITAVMLIESGGQPEVVSRSGAVGLMQVMPRDGIAATFQCPAGPCFANRPSMAELKDPAFNIDYGVRLLASNNTRTGSMREALKSYGPHNVGYTYADRTLFATIKGG